ncbi:hypothetical protein [Dialister invisus]|jgi:hypothetical protein|uniref:hypothetical protein n=1 Tax=Dialister invisus TaxID=218538 RepID=UPI003AB84F22
MRTIKNHAILFVIGLTISTGAFSLFGNTAAAEEPPQMRDYRLSLFQSGGICCSGKEDLFPKARVSLYKEV